MGTNFSAHVWLCEHREDDCKCNAIFLNFFMKSNDTSLELFGYRTHLTYKELEEIFEKWLEAKDKKEIFTIASSPYFSFDWEPDYGLCDINREEIIVYKKIAYTLCIMKKKDAKYVTFSNS